MRISKLKIENYRNLDGVAISFDEDVTYIVGENDRVGNVGVSAPTADR